VVPQEIPLVSKPRHRFEADGAEIGVTVEAEQALVLVFVIVTVEADLHRREIAIRLTGTLSIGGVAEFAGVFHVVHALERQMLFM